MKTTKLVVMLIIAASISEGCTRNGGSVYEVITPDDAVMDPLIVGNWIQQRVTMVENTSVVTIDGIQISDTGAVRSLAIETATGKLAVRPNRFYYHEKKIVAKNGRVFRTRYSVGSEDVIDSGTYRIENAQLTMVFSGLAEVYTKSTIGEALVAPVQSKFSVKEKGNVQQTTIENDMIASSPSAYVKSISTANNHFLAIIGNDEDSWIEIKISNYQGIGRYTLGDASSNYAKRTVFLGDYWISGQTGTFPNGVILTGEVIIESFDLVTNTCKGTFHFEAGRFDEYNKQLYTASFTDGNFTVPIYQ